MPSHRFLPLLLSACLGVAVFHGGAAQARAKPPPRPPARHGMVVAANPLAAEAGLQHLQAGFRRQRIGRDDHAVTDGGARRRLGARFSRPELKRGDTQAGRKQEAKETMTWHGASAFTGMTRSRHQ